MVRGLALFLCLTSFGFISVNGTAQDRNSSVKKGQSGSAGGEELPPGTTLGPSVITLPEGSGQVKLPKGMVFLDRTRTEEAMRRAGEPVGKGTLGMVVPMDGGWAAFLHHANTGYIRDNDADKMNASDLMNQLKEGNNEANEERKKMGSTPLEIVGWSEQPHYDKAQHTLSWSIIVRDQGATEQTINHTSVVLGRFGIMDATVVGDYAKAAALKPKLELVKGMLTFRGGSDYSSYQSGDRISDLTMTGLVAGGGAAAAFGAAKLGLFGKIGAALLALKKALIVVVIAVGAAVKKIWAKITGNTQSA